VELATVQIGIVLFLVVAVFAGFVWERLSPDVVAMLAEVVPVLRTGFPLR
jgi:hypothetical protein